VQAIGVQQGDLAAGPVGEIDGIVQGVFGTFGEISRNEDFFHGRTI
jgi:hypothetical protein